jgi:hypothetical protein
MGSLSLKILKRPFGAGRLVLLLIAGLLFYLAITTGLLGRALGYARLAVHPVDRGLVSFFDAGAAGVSVTHLPFVRLPHNAELRREVAKFALVLRKETGIRLIMDVDSVAMDDRQEVLVARGRFNADLLAQKLARHGFKRTLYREQTVIVHPKDRESVALVGPYLLAGPAAVVKRAVDRHLDKKGLRARHRISKKLDAIGWKHGVFGAARLDDPAYRGLPRPQRYPGVAEPEVRTASGAVDFLHGDYPITVLLTFRSPDEAREAIYQSRIMRDEIVRELRRSPESWAPALADALEKMVIEGFEKDGMRLHMVLPGQVVDAWLDGTSALIRLGGRCKRGTPDQCLRSLFTPFRMPMLIPRNFGFSFLKAAEF